MDLQDLLDVKADAIGDRGILPRLREAALKEAVSRSVWPCGGTAVSERGVKTSLGDTRDAR